MLRRVAIITHEVPNSFYAGGMQLLRVFDSYPAESLVVVGPSPPDNARKLACDYRTLAFPLMRWRNTRFHSHVMSLFLLSAWARRSPAHIERILGSFNPEVVFTVMDVFSHYYTAYEYARRRRLPLVTMTMDAPDSFEKIFPVFKGLQQRKIGDVYRYAERNLCVSRQMTAHISKSYGCAAETFYFGPPDGVTLREPAESEQLRRPGQLVLGYAGGLTYGYGEALRRIAEVLRGQPVTIRIYSRNRPSWPEATNVEYAGCFEPEETWRRFKSECDVSLLVYNFDYHESRLYRTHFPTKLSEYSWLGMPMVMAGPEYATGIIWGLEHPAATLVETDRELSGLVRNLEDLRNDGPRRRAMAEAVALAAKEEFEPSAIKTNFEAIVGG
jgi:hypothetical protein